METVGKIGRYISKGVYIVSGPFHPFGGAVDIIVVEQPDGSFKSSPWYVRFGKFQGVLKTREKIVKLCVNGVEADVNMYLNHKGEAYFFQEVEEEDTEWKPLGGGRPLKSKSCDFDTNRHHIKGRSYSRSSSRCLGCYGRGSIGEDFDNAGEVRPGMIRRDSLERAEIVAELLEFKWSTNLYSRRRLRQLKVAGVGDGSDVDGAKGSNGENKKGLHCRKSSEDGKPHGDDVRSCAKGSTVGSISTEEKSGTDESRTSSETSGSYISGSDGSVKSSSGILSPPETVQLDKEEVIPGSNERKLFEMESMLQTVTYSVFLDPPPLSSLSIHDGDGSRNDCSHANGGTKSQTDAKVKFHLGYSEESRHGVFGQVGENVQVDASPNRGGDSPNSSSLDGNMRNIRSPKRNVTSRIMNGIKRVKSLPDMVSRFKSKSKRAFHHSRSQSLDSAAPILSVSSLSPTRTGGVNVDLQNPLAISASVSPEDGRGSLCYPLLPDSSYMNGSETSRPRLVRKMVRVLKPTSNQLASLNLKEGCNIVTFLFYTSMLGKQQVDARIYLWKWNSRVIISDVDGTITKSDVLGQFMPLMGIDWSHVGVTNLYSAIKENGYHMLFLSARAITQACLTRRFLINLNQNGKALPDGPVVISPDGLFPSLYREVIIRRPHEFKIACLEEIKSLFPPDCNPFYAGFGNRDTDEISYLKVGIPKGKIFIINPKGEVAVNRHVDTKSYTSLHSLVHGMFPPPNSAEQEDFNSWNFWKMPLPLMDI